MDKLQKLMFLNIRGLLIRKRKDKLQQLSEIAREDNVVFVAIVESHLREEILTAEVSMRGFSLLRVDRSSDIKQGGIVLYIREDMARNFGQAHSGSVDKIEFLCTHSSSLNLVLCVVYRPEGTSTFETVIREIREYANKRGPPMPNVLIVGDFNFPQVDWKMGTVVAGGKSASEKRAAHILFDICNDLCLTQIVRDATRGPNVLDLVLTNNTDLLHKCTVWDPGLSDHRAVTVSHTLPQQSVGECLGEVNPLAALNFFF